MLHFCFLQLAVEDSVGILEFSVAVKQRMSVWIRFNSRIQSIEYQSVVVSVTDDIGDDSAVIQVKDRTEIHLVYNGACVPLEFRHIRQSFLVGHGCVKLSVQLVLCNMLWVGSLSGTAVVLVLDR